MLCKNRLEGFSTHSIYSSHLPTTCFIDTILLPLPTILLLIALPILFAIHLATKRKSNTHPTTTLPRSKRVSCCGTPNGQTRSISHKILTSFYTLFTLASLLLSILEIARLTTINHGIALLPIPIIGICLAMLLHFTHGFFSYIPHWQVVNMAFWALSTVFSVIKTVGLEEEGWDKRKGSRYPLEDQITDTGVAAGLFLFLVGIEGWLWRLRRRMVMESVVRGEEEEVVKEKGIAERGRGDMGSDVTLREP